MEFKYTLERSDIEAYLRLTAEEKLEWLEEIADFSEKAMTPEAKAIRDLFRSEETISEKRHFDSSRLRRDSLSDQVKSEK